MNNYDFDNPWQEESEEQPQHIEGIYEPYGYAVPQPDEEINEGTGKKKLPDWAILSVLAVLVVIVAVFCVNAVRKGISIFEMSVPVENQTQVQSVAPEAQTSGTTVQSTAQTTLQPSTVPTEGTLAATTIAQSVASTAAVQAETTAAVPAEPTKEEILKAVGDAINSLKAPTAGFTGKRSQVISLKLLDCSMPVMVEPVNKVLEFFAGEKLNEWDFTNGKTTDPETGEEITSSNAIPPTDKPFTLTVDGVAEATHQKDGANDVYTIKVVPESSSLANPRPPYHNSACDTFDLTKVELPMGEVTRADFEYPGATVSVTINPEGKVVHYQERLEIKGTGEGKLGITASGTIEGSIEEKWDINWK